MSNEQPLSSAEFRKLLLEQYNAISNTEPVKPVMYYIVSLMLTQQERIDAIVQRVTSMHNALKVIGPGFQKLQQDFAAAVSGEAPPTGAAPLDPTQPQEGDLPPLQAATVGQVNATSPRGGLVQESAPTPIAAPEVQTEPLTAEKAAQLRAAAAGSISQAKNMVQTSAPAPIAAKP